MQVDLKRRVVRLLETQNTLPRTLPLSATATELFREALNHPVRPIDTDLIFFGEPGRDGKRHPYPSKRARDYENTTGEKCAERIAIEQAAPILKDARSWSEVHERLGQLGMRYEQKGSDALLWVGEIAIKASACGREFSRKRMEERLGTLKADARPLKSTATTNEAEPLDQNATPKLAEYRATLRQYRAEKEVVQTTQRVAHRTERIRQLQELRAERAELNKDAKWSGAALNVARSLLAADHAKRRAALSEQQKRQRSELRQRFGRRLT